MTEETFRKGSRWKVNQNEVLKVVGLLQSQIDSLVQALDTLKYRFELYEEMAPASVPLDMDKSESKPFVTRRPLFPTKAELLELKQSINTIDPKTRE